MVDVTDSVSVLKDVVALTRRERIVLTAGSVAYFTFLSLVPLLLLLVVALSVFQGEALARQVVSRATHALAPESASRLQDLVFGAANRQQATVVSAGVLLWGALLTFRALNTAFAGIYDTYRERNLRGTVGDVILVFVVIVLAVIAMIAAGVVVSMFVRTQLWNALGPVVLFSTLAIVFLPLYYILPDRDIQLGEALPGTIFAAGAWTVLQALFGYYVAISSMTELYGAASAFLLILLWLYVGGFVLLVGAALNMVLAGRADPDAEWVPTEDS